MRIKNRDGVYEELKLENVVARIKNLSHKLEIDCDKLALDTIRSLVDGISTSEIDSICASIAHDCLLHPDYDKLALRLCVSSLHKDTRNKFSNAMEYYHQDTDRLDFDKLTFILAHREEIDKMISNDRDYDLTYNGIQNLLISKNYLLRDSQGTLIERPQYLFMRSAIQSSYRSDRDLTTNLRDIRECYDMLSCQLFTFATPTLMNSCLRDAQCLSCFLGGTGDSCDDIMKNLHKCAQISKNCGGIGLHMNNIRAAGSLIKSSGGRSLGLPSQLRLYNSCMQVFNQGGKRSGSCAIFLSPWHADFQQWVQLKSKVKSPETSGLFYGCWIDDLFMERLRDGKLYSLFSPDDAPGLDDVFDGMKVCKKCCWSHNRGYRQTYGDLLNRGEWQRSPKCIPGLESEEPDCVHEWVLTDAFSDLYEYYETRGKARETVDPKRVVEQISRMRRETGVPYVLFKDHVNRQSMSQNFETIKGSNLCCETLLPSDKDNFSSCVLGNLILPSFADNRSFDFNLLGRAVRVLTRRLDNLIDCNAYPIKECVDYAQSYRPLGIGIQGLQDALTKMGLPFLSASAERIDLTIAECLYFQSLEESCTLAKERGAFKGFDVSPIGIGKLHLDLWKDNQARMGNAEAKPHSSGFYDWSALRKRIKHFGVRNSYLTAYMPTVSTSFLFQNTDSFEPYSNLVGTSDTLSGRVIVVAKDLAERMSASKIWNDRSRTVIMDENSLSKLENPELAEIAPLYKTVWECGQKQLMARSAKRSAFIDQSSSFNLFLIDPTLKMLENTMVDAWMSGLKTGCYYTRTKAAAKPMNVCKRDDPSCSTCAM